MIFIERLREEKKQKCRVITSLVFFIIFVPIFIGCMIYYFGEKSHYGETVCKISNCSITYTNVCTHGRAFYSCYGGFFDYHATWLDGNYIKNGNGFLDADSPFYYNCINKGTFFCTFDDRNIQSSLTAGQQPNLAGVAIVNIISAIFILTAIIMLVIFIMSTLCLANIKKRIQSTEKFSKNQPEVIEEPKNTSQL